MPAPAFAGLCHACCLSSPALSSPGGQRLPAARAVARHLRQAHRPGPAVFGVQGARPRAVRRAFFHRVALLCRPHCAGSAACAHSKRAPHACWLPWPQACAQSTAAEHAPSVLVLCCAVRPAHVARPIVHASHELPMLAWLRRSCACTRQAMLPQMGHIASGGGLNRSRLLQLLVFLSRDEEAAYKRRAVRADRGVGAGLACSSGCAESSSDDVPTPARAC